MKTTLELVDKILNDAQEEHLLTEVVISALHAMGNNPNLTIEEVIQEGYNEWVK